MTPLIVIRLEKFIFEKRNRIHLSLTIYKQRLFILTLYTVLFFAGLRARILIGTAWLLSLLFAVPELILFHVQFVPRIGGHLCMIDLKEPQYWQVRT